MERRAKRLSPYNYVRGAITQYSIALFLWLEIKVANGNETEIVRKSVSLNGFLKAIFSIA